VIEELRIRGLGVIEESVLELGPGFTAITGETGAGKTMVVSALGLLLGGRSDAGAVRTGTPLARVEGVVDVSGSPEVAEVVDGAGGVVEEGRVVLARQVTAEGRSRAFAGGAVVPVGVLTRCADTLVAVHGQSDQHRLLRPTAQRDALDLFAGSDALGLKQRYQEAWSALRAADAELKAVTASLRERAQEADLLRFGLSEIEAVSPVPGEDAALAEEESRLAFADTLRAAAEGARELLSADTASQDVPDALGAVSAARRQLDGVREHDPQAAELADRLTELSYLLGDLAADVAAYASSLETDPLRLAAVSERRAALTALTRKYGDSVDEVLAWSSTAARRLLDLEDTDEHLERLREERARRLTEVADLGSRLSAVRGSAAAALGAAVTAELTGLAMPHARVEVHVRQLDDPAGVPLTTGSSATGSSATPGEGGRRVKAGADGFDEVELRLAANAGSEPRPLHRGASGGELSRVMLALEVALAGTSPVPTFVFDEVDAGIGGAAAVEVGRRLGLLARHAQVVVVTHLPQVAAFADRHVVVVKSADGSVTTSGLSVLDEEGRLRELSRMLAGFEESDAARAHAQELLEAARQHVG
jgi:DNA repair protein RecN (Recombination protein N)